MNEGGLVTRASLAADLAALGVRRGDTLLVHASLRSLGWACGGPVAVVLALRDALGPDGTLVVPAQTPYPHRRPRCDAKVSNPFRRTHWAYQGNRELGERQCLAEEAG